MEDFFPISHLLPLTVPPVPAFTPYNLPSTSIRNKIFEKNQEPSMSFKSVNSEICSKLDDRGTNCRTSTSRVKCVVSWLTARGINWSYNISSVRTCSPNEMTFVLHLVTIPCRKLDLTSLSWKTAGTEF